MIKAKKKPAKKEPSVSSLLKRIASLERKFNAHDVELGSHVEQLDKHQRTLELIEQREQFISPSQDVSSGFSGPQ
jgi:hypothetical protein